MDLGPIPIPNLKIAAVTFGLILKLIENQKFQVILSTVTVLELKLDVKYSPRI